MIKLFESFGDPAQLQVLFGCETIPFKRHFIVNMLHANAPQQRHCMFCNLEEMAQGGAKCWTHHGGQFRCSIPRRVHFLTCGFSCKTLSTLNSTCGAAKKVALPSVSGSSGGTFADLIRHISWALPYIVVLENLEGLAQPGANSEHLWAEFERLCYTGSCCVLNASEFLLPQHRSRAFFILIHCDSFGITLQEGCRVTSEMVTTLRNLVPKLQKKKSQNSDMKSFLLNPNDEYLVTELARREKAMSTKPQTEAWKTTHKTFMMKKGLTTKDCILPWDVYASAWVRTLTERDRECLVLALAVHGADASVSSIDVSQHVDRVFAGRDNVTPTLVPNSKLWMLSEQRPLLGWECMA